MSEYNKEKAKFFGEHCEYDSGEKEEARQYLESWKKFLIRKLTKDSYDVKIVDEQWYERGPEFSGMLCQRSSMALKIYIEADWHYELGHGYK